MNNLVDVLEILTLREEVLSKRAQDYFKALQRGDVDRQKRAKIVRGILYFTLVEYKETASPEASEVIVSCFRSIIAEWKTLKDSTSFKLSSLLKAALNRAHSIEKDLTHLQELGRSIESYFSVAETDAEVASCFLFATGQLCKSEYPCACPLGSRCDLLESFSLELQALKVRGASDGKLCNASETIVTAALKHLGRHNFTKEHLDKLLSALDGFILTYDQTSQEVYFLNFIKSIITVEGNLLLGEKNLALSFEDVYTFSKTFLCENSQCPSFVSTYLLIFCHHLSSLAKHCHKLKDCLDISLKCIDLLYSKGRKLLTIEIFASIAYFYHKITSVEKMEVIFKRTAILVDNVSEKFDQTTHDDEALVRFLETVVHMCVVAFNNQAGGENLDRAIENCLEKLLDHVVNINLTNNSKMNAILSKIGTVLAKTKRSLGEYLSAMEVVETAIKMCAFDNVEPLVTQWVKIKRSAVLENGTMAEKVARRTLASNLRESISEKFLSQILCLELELYESLNFSRTEKLAVSREILLHNCEETSRSRPELTCNFITLQFELQDCSPGEIDFASAYVICKSDADTWEYFVKLKLVEFLETWNKLIGTEGESSLKVNLTPILDIVECFECAAKENFSVLHMERTCEVAHSAAAALSLFGHQLRSLKIMGALWILLQNDCSNICGTRLWNISSAMCEIASTYLALRQLSAAEKYSKLALFSFNKYSDWLSDCGSGDNNHKLKKFLFFKVQATLAKVLGKSGKDADARKILNHCLSDDFLQRDNLRKSFSAIISSVELLGVSALLLDDLNPRLCRLQSWLKRIASLQASMMPAFHHIQTSPSGSEVQSFGIVEHGNHRDAFVQIRLIDCFFTALYGIVEANISMGSPKTAGAYIQMGLVRAKYLHLKRWYVHFCLSRVKILSLTDNESFPVMCKNFCELVQCECRSTNSCILEDSFLQKEEDDEIQTGEEDAESEMYGSADDDAIQIPTRPLDTKSLTSSSDDFLASPAIAKRKRRQPLQLPPIFQKKKSCPCETVLSLRAVELEYANIFAEHCARTSLSDDGMEICGKLLKIVTAMKDESVSSIFENIKAFDYFSCLVAETHIINSQFYLDKNGKKTDALKCHDTAKKMLQNCDITDPLTLSLKSKVHYLAACLIEDKDVVVQQLPDPSYLNAVIDGIGSIDITNSDSALHTPISGRSRRKIGSSMTAKRSDAKGRSAKVSRLKKTKGTETFTIYEDKENKHHLPVPQYITDRSSSPCGKDTYDFESSGDERKSSRKKLPRDVQNIKLARKVALRRHKKEFGMVYTEEAKEKVRGRTAKPRQVKRETNSRNKATTVKTPLLSSCSNNHSTTENWVENTGNLQQALQSACDADDFLMSKLSAQRLSQCYYAAFCKSQDLFLLSQSVVFHLFSIGVVTRGAMRVYAQTIMDIQSHQSQNDSGDANSFNNHSLWNYIDLRKLLKTASESGIQYVTEIVDLLPEKWTVCALSLCKSPKAQLLVTRLNPGKNHLHFQISGEVLQQLLTKFHDLMDRNSEALKSKDKAYWWTQRRNLDAELKGLIDSLGQNVLGHYSGLLQGVLKDANKAGELEKCIQEIATKFALSDHKSGILEILLNSWSNLTPEDKLAGVIELCGSTSLTRDHIASVAKELETASVKLLLEKETREHVILILDKDVQLLPWENVPQLRGSSVTRLPSVDLLKTQLVLLKSAEKSIASRGVNLKDVSYVLNPNGDLMKSEGRFQEWFQSIKSWKGIISREPLQNEWISSITDFDLFIFCGHGAGTKYMSTNDFRKVRTRAAALLMGCGSAKLDQDGIFEPDGIVLHYLITGSPCVLGCLWKITDKDIDIYLCKLLEYWANGEKIPISISAAKAQSHMKMPHINGAACVTYGLPIHCQVTIAKFVQSLPKI